MAPALIISYLLRYRRWPLVLILMSLFLYDGREAEGSPLILDYGECVRLALENNDEIRAADQEIELSTGKMAETRRRGIPAIHYQYRVAPVPEDIDNAAGSFFDGDITVFNSLKLEMGSPLSTFGKIETAQELARLGIDASWFKRQKKVEDIVFKMYQVYQGILLARELLSLASQAQDAIGGKIGELEGESTIDQLQILKLKVALYEVERKVEEAKKREKLALLALMVQMGIEGDVDFNIKDRTLNPVSFKLRSIDYYLERSKKHRAEYKLLEAGMRAKEGQLKIEKLNAVPNLGIGGFFDIGRAPHVRGGEDETSFTNPFNYTKAGIGLELKGELDFVRLRAKVKQAQADLLKVIYEKRAAIKGLEIDIQKSYFDVGEAESLMQKASREKKAARQMVFLTKSNLEIGLGEKKDYLDALQSYLVFQGREYESRYNFNVAVFGLLQKTGSLDPIHSKEEP